MPCAKHAMNEPMSPEPASSAGWSAGNVSVVVPTYRRGKALLDTLRQLFAQDFPPLEIIVVDQTETHPPEVELALRQMETDGRIRRVRFAPPSIPRAMNAGLREAAGDVVLFLDDDVEPAPDLVAAHAVRLGGGYGAVCGQVLQPGEAPDPAANRGPRPMGFPADLDFRFCGTEPTELRNVMAGNLSILRSVALSIGGFDERFVGSAYRFETDLARRLLAAGHRILFAPEASVRHLRLSTGGTRSAGSHLARFSPMHSVGDYYFAMRHASGTERWGYILHRPVREICKRYFLRHPWKIPAKAFSELRACILAFRLHRQGPRLGGRP